MLAKSTGVWLEALVDPECVGDALRCLWRDVHIASGVRLKDWSKYAQKSWRELWDSTDEQEICEYSMAGVSVDLVWYAHWRYVYDRAESFEAQAARIAAG